MGMRILAVIPYGGSDRPSGTLGAVLQRLAAGTDVEVLKVGPLRRGIHPRAMARWAFHNAARRGSYRADFDPDILRGYAAQVEAAVKLHKPNLVYAPGTIPIAYLGGTCPLVFYSDSTFALNHGFYWPEEAMSRASIENGHRYERAALSRCALAIYSSQWAAASAVNDYGCEPSKVRSVPRGSNVDKSVVPPDPEEALAVRSRDRCVLTLVGVDWERKGGPIAVEIAALLRDSGVPAELHVIGCEVPSPFRRPFVVGHGYVSKATPEGARALASAMAASHFLLLPTTADCTPIVVPEAYAFAVPCMAASVGAIPELIPDGRTGHVLAPTAPPGEWAAVIERLWREPDRYRGMALAAHNEYATRLNWDTSARRILGHIREVLTGT